MNTRTFRDQVAGYLSSHPDQWISAYALMSVGGALAFRTRVSECRTQLGMVVDNKVERDSNGVATSFYRYRPAQRCTDVNSTDINELPLRVGPKHANGAP